MSLKGKRVIGIIQARSGSTRLPGKVLKDMAGAPLLYYVIERAKCSRLVDMLVLATTDCPEDQAVAEMGRGCGIKVFRGHEDDVLGRFIDCLKWLSEDFDLLVRINADNPLICAEVIDHALEHLLNNNLDVVNPFLSSATSYPFGVGAEVCSIDTLLEVHRCATDPKHREHILFYAYERKDRFAISGLEAPSLMQSPELSVTVDTMEEFEKVTRFLTPLSMPQRLSLTVCDIIAGLTLKTRKRS